MSYWDCGEYISTSYKLEVGHAPGAPLFQMIGRFFSLFAFGRCVQGRPHGQYDVGSLQRIHYPFPFLEHHHTREKNYTS